MSDALCLCPADRFVAPTPERVHRSTPLSRRIGRAPSPMPDLLFRAKHLFLGAMVEFPLASGQGRGTGASSGRKGLAAWLSPHQTCRRPMVLQRKSNAATVNLDRSSGDERAIADT